MFLSDKETEIKEKFQCEVNGVGHSHTSIDPPSKPDIDTRTSQTEISDGTGQSRKHWQKLFTSCITLHRGWNIYRNYEIVFAGLSLASLYLTVLSFHYITTGKWAIYRNYEIVFAVFSLISPHCTSQCSASITSQMVSGPFIEIVQKYLLASVSPHCTSQS